MHIFTTVTHNYRKVPYYDLPWHNIISFFRSELSSLDPALKNRCQRLAQSIACHSVYPYCDPSHDVPTPRLICKTSCDAFSAGGICERFISEAETPELYSRLADKCDTREHPAGSSPECIPIDVETAQIGRHKHQ